MPQLTLYHAAPSRSSVVHWMLEELGEPYDTHILNLKAGDNRKPEYLAINPMGKVPAIKHGDVVDHRGVGDLHLSGRCLPARPGLPCRSAIRAAAPISNGCSSSRAAWSPRSSTAPSRARRRRPPPRSATATMSG